MAPTTTFTHFTKLGRDLHETFKVTGVCNPDMDALEAADAEINAHLEELDATAMGPTDDTLAEVGRTWASSTSKNRDKNLMDAMVLAAAYDKSRYAKVRAGAATAYVAEYEQRNGWAPRPMIESMRAPVRKWAEDLAERATTLLENLPPEGLEHVRKAGARNCTTLIDLATTPGSVIEDYRACEQLWNLLYSRVDDVYLAFKYGILAGAEDYDVPDAMWKSTMDLFGPALMFDADGVAACELGFSPEVMVLDGMGKVAPLIDPMGEDADEYERRNERLKDVRGFLADQLIRRKPRIYNCNEMMMEALDVMDGKFLLMESKYEIAGFKSPEEALAAYKASLERRDAPQPEPVPDKPARPRRRVI